eukprot:TRINITY_DN11905_c0_g2_i1.p1 TRINITY_DN11905_c0_g2~~TRINITY_DN11905_c0_g2_i1.p1  ORF type:complete len:1370 (+),score=549.00 TRINITY_DN11905_c0_g2_i1:155-4264(+)
MNNYQIYEKIGKGRHSTVYKGRLKKTVDYYAIKSVDKAQRSRVLNEVTMLHQLSHENILHFHHWYETNNHLWLIEEYCTGSDVLTLIKQDKSLPEETLVTFASDLLSAVNYIHSRGIIYCDLKPSNVLIDAHGFLKLSDFGLARHIDNITAERKIGTPTYMAPELFQDGGVVSFASDLWSLGIVLYELYVGLPPFVDQKLDGLIQKIVYNEYDPPQGCSRGFADVLEGLLEKDPLERLDWVELPNHEFWKEKKTCLAVPLQPAFEQYKSRRMAEGTAKTAKEAKEVRERRKQQVAKISATAQQNMVREQQAAAYGDATDAKHERFEADTEVDFGDNNAGDEEDEDAGKEGAEPTGVKGDSAPGELQPTATVEEADLARQVTAPAAAPEANTPAEGAYAEGGAERKDSGQAAEGDTAGDFHALMFHPSDNHVKPIMCNTKIERLSEAKFDASILPFPAHSLQEVCAMETEPLEAFLNTIYKAIGGKTTISDKQHCLCYFETLCGATKTANLFINSLLMSLFVKMVHNKSYPPALKARLCLIMGLLIRHATFITAELMKTGIVKHLLSLVTEEQDAKNVKVTRRAVACLGELLFYIGTQQPADREAWGVGADTAQTFCSALTCDDEVTRHYAVKTIENITGHSDADYAKSYAAKPVITSLLNVFNPVVNIEKPPPAKPNDYLRASAISSVSRICRLHHGSLAFVLEEMKTEGLIDAFANGSSARTLQSCLNLLNLLLAKTCLYLAAKARDADADANGMLQFIDMTPVSPLQSRSSFDGHGDHIFKELKLSEELCASFLTDLNGQREVLVKGLMASLEHSSPAIRGKTMLCCCLLSVCSMAFLQECCECKLIHLLERIGKETSDKYLLSCSKTFTKLLASAGASVTKRLQTQLSGSGVAEATKQHLSIVLHMLTAQSIRGSVIQPSLIQTISACLALAEPTSDRDGSVMSQLLLMSEAMSQDAAAMRRFQQDVVKHLLPVLTQLLDSKHGDTRFISLKIFIDVLVPYLHEGHGGDDGARPQSPLQRSMSTLILKSLFPKLMVLLDDEEPIPLYGLKLLNSVATENPQYVAELAGRDWMAKLFDFFELEHRNNNVHNVKLILKIVTCETVALGTVFSLGVVAKLNNVLAFSFQNGVESFYDPCLEICLNLLERCMRSRVQAETTRSDADKATYAGNLQNCEALVQNVELCAKLSIDSEAADTASKCLMLCSQLYPQKVRDLWLSDKLRPHLRLCLSEHTLKGDAHDVTVVGCILKSVLAVLTLGDEATKTKRKSCVTKLIEDDLLIGGIREVTQPLSGLKTTPQVLEVQALAASLTDIVYGRGTFNAPATPADPNIDSAAPPFPEAEAEGEGVDGNQSASSESSTSSGGSDAK